MIERKLIFEQICRHFQKYSEVYTQRIKYFSFYTKKISTAVYSEKVQTSLCFVLGFYVSLVVTRWWAQYLHIQTPVQI